MNLHRFQEDSVASVVAAIEAGNDPVIVAPTGSGKTVIAAEIMRRAKNKFVLVLAHRRELIHQAKDKLARFDVKAGIILAGPMLLHLCLEGGDKPGAASYRCEERFGHWPLDHRVEPVPPDREVIAWDRHCRIRYAKAMQKAAS